MPNFPKYTLAIETATQKGSLSLLREQDEIANWAGNDRQTLSSLLLPQISALLSRHNLTTNDLELIAVSAGPGSFTGVRVGLAIAKAFKAALGIKAVAVSLPEALALSVESPAGVITIIPAGRDEVYWQEFECGQAVPVAVAPVSNKALAEIESLGERKTVLVATSDLKPEYLEVIEKRAGQNVYIAPDGLAKYVGIYAVQKYALNLDTIEHPVSPIYVKEFGW